jgi:hypothetical protein
MLPLVKRSIAAQRMSGLGRKNDGMKTEAGIKRKKMIIKREKTITRIKSELHECSNK